MSDLKVNRMCQYLYEFHFKIKIIKIANGYDASLMDKLKEAMLFRNSRQRKKDLLSLASNFFNNIIFFNSVDLFFLQHGHERIP
jgi:hypothetical protein